MSTQPRKDDYLGLRSSQLIDLSVMLLAVGQNGAHSRRRIISQNGRKGSLGRHGKGEALLGLDVLGVKEEVVGKEVGTNNGPIYIRSFKLLLSFVELLTENGGSAICPRLRDEQNVLGVELLNRLKPVVQTLLVVVISSKGHDHLAHCLALKGVHGIIDRVGAIKISSTLPNGRDFTYLHSIISHLQSESVSRLGDPLSMTVTTLNFSLSSPQHSS